MTEDDNELVYELRKFQPDTTMCNEAADRIGEITGRIFIIDFNSGDVTISPALNTAIEQMREAHGEES